MKVAGLFFLGLAVFGLTHCKKEAVDNPLDTSLTNVLYEGSGCNSFKRVLHSLSGSIGRSVKVLDDGGYVITGTIGTSGKKSVAFLVRTNCEGEITWSKTFSDIYSVKGYEVLVTADHGFLILTTSATDESTDYYRDITSNVVLIRTDDMGNVKWKANFPLRWYQATSLFLDNCPDGGYILAGMEYSGTTVNVIKIDHAGKEVWRNPFPQLKDLRQCKVNQNGNIILGGANAVKNTVLIYANPFGNVAWTRVLRDSSDEAYLYALNETSSGDILISYFATEKVQFQTKRQFYMRLINTGGDSIWEKPVDYGVGNIANTNDQGFILSRGNCLIRLNMDGDSIWTQCYDNDVYSTFYEIHQSSSGGYVGTGIYENSIWFVKVDENGI